jgi:hypothetical protein
MASVINGVLDLADGRGADILSRVTTRDIGQYKKCLTIRDCKVIMQSITRHGDTYPEHRALLGTLYNIAKNKRSYLEDREDREASQVKRSCQPTPSELDQLRADNFLYSVQMEMIANENAFLKSLVDTLTKKTIWLESQLVSRK